MQTINLSWSRVAELVDGHIPKKGLLFGVPRGGIIPAAIAGAGRMVDDPQMADFIIDDIVDSGRTREHYRKNYPHAAFRSLIDKTSAKDRRLFPGWVKFPWEVESSGGPEDAVVRMLQFIGEDPAREGLLETPKRVVKSWREQTTGYGQDPAAILGTDFDCGRYDEMVTVPRIEFYSNCEHHMLPFFGHAYVGYLPNRRSLRVVGLSKIARVVDVFARRLQVQERLTMQIADAIENHLKAAGVIVVIEAKHHCMCARGVQKHQSSMVTSAVRGKLRLPAARAEFFSLIRLQRENR